MIERRNMDDKNQKEKKWKISPIISYYHFNKNRSNASIKLDTQMPKLCKTSNLILIPCPVLILVQKSPPSNCNQCKRFSCARAVGQSTCSAGIIRVGNFLDKSKFYKSFLYRLPSIKFLLKKNI